MNCQKLSKCVRSFATLNNIIECNRMFALIVFIALIIDVLGELSGHDVLK